MFLELVYVCIASIPGRTSSERQRRLVYVEIDEYVDDVDLQEPGMQQLSDWLTLSQQV